MLSCHNSPMNDRKKKYVGKQSFYHLDTCWYGLILDWECMWVYKLNESEEEHIQSLYWLMYTKL